MKKIKVLFNVAMFFIRTHVLAIKYWLQGDTWTDAITLARYITNGGWVQ